MFTRLRFLAPAGPRWALSASQLNDVRLLSQLCEIKMLRRAGKTIFIQDGITHTSILHLSRFSHHPTMKACVSVSHAQASNPARISMRCRCELFSLLLFRTNASATVIGHESRKLFRELLIFHVERRWFSPL